MTNALPRFFFPASRAHHAYVMAKDFGMEFIRKFEKWNPEGLVHLHPSSEYRIYVHADSMGLLEPMVRDVVTTDLHGPVLIARFEQLAGRQLVVGRADCYGEECDFYPESITAIIQRAGKPFCMPEVEP